MKTLTILLALLISMIALVALPSASAQESPDIPYVPYLPGTLYTPVGQYDGNPTDGWTECKRTFGVNVCFAIDRSDCFLWFSAGTGGCFID